MPYHSATFSFIFETSRIMVDEGSPDVDCGNLYDAIKEAQASEEGIQYEPIAIGSGLVPLGDQVAVGLTVELLGAWQLQYAPGNYVARVAGGNLVGGPNGDPIAYTPGVQVLLIQSAASTVVSVSDANVNEDTLAAAVWARNINNNSTPNTAGYILRAIHRVASLIPGLF